MKLACKFFIVAYIAAFLVSCGGDDEPDYSVSDLSVLEGTYSGTCEVSITDIGGKEVQTRNTTVRLDKTSKKDVLALYTNESGAIIGQGDILVDFKRTPDNLGYTFNIKGFYFEYTYTKNEDDYIHQWFGTDYSDDIKNIKITISPSSAKYTLSSKTLTFTCKGTVSFVGVFGNNQTPVTRKIEYKYSVGNQ
ncbi:MAG: hypothetical protein LBR97_04045 [Dysgonamonadaceae bacterium]|jgi:hypothetical protein|nr:hypothetical protein [Dysgonamonadaceae bacterium]